MSEQFPRRRFLATGGAASALAAGHVLLGPALLEQDGAVAAVRSYGGVPLPRGLFTLGVASGDPSPDGFVLWTRLAPRPVDGGGMPDRPVPVSWQVAEDERFLRIRASGTETARPGQGHAVHAEVGGLRPDREYFYRFRAGGELSPTGRSRTAPSHGAVNRRLKFAFASCQNWQDGYFTAYHHLAQEDLAFVTFLGDYIYESVPRTTTVRTHEGTDEPYTLTDYRNRHAQYKTDTNLQAAHAAFPGSRHGTTTNSTTTGPTRSPRTRTSRRTPRSWPAAPPRSRRTTSTCPSAGPPVRAASTCDCTAGSPSAGSPPSTSSTPASTAATSPPPSPRPRTPPAP